VVALAQNDIKRLIAYSTISHLGLMFTALGVGAFSAALFHLVTHAWFKALLFLAAGNLIVAFNTQDLREMGGAWKRMRTTSLALFAGACSAAGVVLFAGFWSKDSIIAGVLRNEFPGGGHVSRSAQALLIIAVAATSFLGAIYPFRMFFMAVAGTPARRRGFNPDRVREAPPAMLSPVVILAVLSVVFGFLGIEGARYTFNKFVYGGASPPTDGIGWGGMALGSSLALAGVAVAYALYLRGQGVSLVQRLGPLRDLARDGFRIDDAYAWVVQRGVLALARLPVRVDDEITDALALGTVDGIGTVAAETPRVQRGRIQGYGLGAVAGVLVVAAGVTLAATGHLPGVGAAR
jgi:NADH-quinone oxidoreductase subunit L